MTNSVYLFQSSSDLNLRFCLTTEEFPCCSCSLRDIATPVVDYNRGVVLGLFWLSKQPHGGAGPQVCAAAALT